MELGRLGKTRELAERNLTEVLGESVDGHRASLSSRGDRAQKLASPVPADHLDQGPDGGLKEHTGIFELSMPVCRQLLRRTPCPSSRELWKIWNGS